MKFRRSFLALSLLLNVMLSSGQPAPPTLNLPHLGSLGSDSAMSADGAGPMIPRGEASFETVKEQERDFARQFNGLIAALHDFSTTYNSGHVIDAKKAKAVRKAWLELEKSGWFRAESPK